MYTGRDDSAALFDGLPEDEPRVEVDDIGFTVLDLHVCFFSDATTLNAWGPMPRSRSTRLWGLVSPMEAVAFFDLVGRFRKGYIGCVSACTHILGLAANLKTRDGGGVGRRLSLSFSLEIILVSHSGG